MGCDFLGGFDKTAAITNAFNIQDNGFRRFIFPQIFQGVNDVDIRLIADADGLAEPDPSFPEIGQRLGHIGAALEASPRVPGFPVRWATVRLSEICEFKHPHAIGDPGSVCRTGRQFL